jgi:hypothetical protein
MATSKLTHMTASLSMKITGIVLGCFTLLLGGGSIVYIVVTGRIHTHMMDVELLTISTVFGLIVIMLWWLRTPQQRHAAAGFNENSNETISYTPLADQKESVSSGDNTDETNLPQDIMSDPIKVNQSMGKNLLESSLGLTGSNVLATNATHGQFRNPAVLQTPVEFPCRAFIVPKEGDDPVQCADKWAKHITSGRSRYAVTDGASTSFLPAQWAQIIANSFVQLNGGFRNHEEAIMWLRTCSQQWIQWVDSTWIPQFGQYARDTTWSREKAQGAQATLIGCSLSSQALQQNGFAKVVVTAVGDANFFLVHPTDEKFDQWQYVSFPCTTPEDFGPVPATLATAEEFLLRTEFKRTSFQLQRGDYIFLTTDALASWILIQLRNQENPWSRLLELSTYEDFRAFVLLERDKGDLESDDTTMLSIYFQ